MTRKTVLGALGAVLGLMLTLLVTPNASADVVATRFHGFGSDRCLDGFGLGNKMHTNPCNDGNFQKFYWNNTPGIHTPIKSVQENLCLQSNVNDVILAKCAPDALAQRWIVAFPAGGGVPFIKSATGSQRCLARTGDGGALIKLEDCRSNFAYHRWVPDR